MNFDIVIPVYNKATTIGELVDLLLESSFFVGKIILIDDCSTDNSYEIISSYMEQYAGVVISKRLECNSGPQVARMYGASLSDKDWVMFIDGDDLVETVSFPKINEILCQIPSSVNLLYGHTEVFRNGISKRNSIKLLKETRFSSLINLLKMPSPTMSGIVVHKSILKLMDIKNCEWGEDLIFYVRAIKEGDFIYIPKTVGIYRQEEQGRGVGGGTLKRRIKFLYLLKDACYSKGSTISSMAFWMYWCLRVMAAWAMKKIKTNA